MTRKIITSSQVSALGTSQPAPDSYTERLVKLVPADLISLYLGFITIVKAFTKKTVNTTTADAASVQATDPTPVYWILFGLMLVSAPWYLKKSGNMPTKQIIICMVSFAVWVFSLGELIQGSLFGFPAEMYVALLVPFYTFMAPTFYK